MKKSLLARIGVGLVMGSVLTVVPTGVAGAADLYDSLQAFSDEMKQHRGADLYDTMEPTAAGPQGPVRSDMMKDAGGYDSGGRSDGGTASAYSDWSPWTDLRHRLGPVGGDGTN